MDHRGLKLITKFDTGVSKGSLTYWHSLTAIGRVSGRATLVTSMTVEM